jgi:hypothetical protein
LTLYKTCVASFSEKLGDEMKKHFVATISFLMFSTPCSAWNATVDGPDIFGKTKVVELEGGLSNSLVVQCDSET